MSDALNDNGLPRHAVSQSSGSGLSCRSLTENLLWHVAPLHGILCRAANFWSSFSIVTLPNCISAGVSHSLAVLVWSRCASPS